MKKRIIRLTESDLHRIVKNSVKKVIKESSVVNSKEKVLELISSTKENIKTLAQMADKGHLDRDVAGEIASFFSSLHYVSESFGENYGDDEDYEDYGEDWYYQEEPGKVADKDDYDWFNIAADGYTSPEEKEESFINRFGNPDDQDEYYTWDKYNSDVDAAWNEHDKQLNNSNRSFKNALKSADKRPLYRKNSPNNDIPKRKRVFR